MVVLFLGIFLGYDLLLPKCQKLFAFEEDFLGGDGDLHCF